MEFPDECRGPTDVSLKNSNAKRKRIQFIAEQIIYLMIRSTAEDMPPAFEATTRDMLRIRMLMEQAGSYRKDDDDTAPLRALVQKTARDIEAHYQAFYDWELLRFLRIESDITDEDAADSRKELVWAMLLRALYTDTMCASVQ